jgi:hypothetical protein
MRTGRKRPKLHASTEYNTIATPLSFGVVTQLRCIFLTGTVRMSAEDKKPLPVGVARSRSPLNHNNA